MMDIQGDFIGQLCHIEAAEEGGERFNASMTNEERRAVANLMLMCYPHHVKTNDVTEYTVEVLQKFKSDHERRFSRTTAGNSRKVDRLDNCRSSEVRTKP